MGKTLLGIDLDESPVGGFVERLLSEEELEKLTDGGRGPRDETGASGRRDTDEPTDDLDGTDLVDDAVDADDGPGGRIPVGTSAGSSAGADTPSPGDERPVGGRVPSPGAEDTDEEGGWKEKLKPILLKGSIALAVLAVVGFLAYRYLGKAKKVASDKLGSDDEQSGSPSPENVTGDVPEARRRAKAPSRDREEYADRPVDETVRHAQEASDSGSDRDHEDEGPSAPRTAPQTRNDSDVGALVGLAALAVVAAAVRKFGEDPPRDPLVDGPADDRDDE
ncbi:hypothetical protein ACFQMA_06430 [Halosimplex aquaticum]|uniref:MYXO-CTERM domain-containing protein n=1 Tax=Halosimplex aquaticum TaxID=3026162 RepID=A0ABD5Y181_9EURY|nr:hypothetical protein [Halosimplex aquaticum]